MSLERFLDAQEDGGCYEQALEELRSGKKETHWIWFVFPGPYKGASSSESKFYALRSRQ